MRHAARSSAPHGTPEPRPAAARQPWRMPPPPAALRPTAPRAAFVHRPPAASSCGAAGQILVTSSPVQQQSSVLRATPRAHREAEQVSHWPVHRHAAAPARCMRVCKHSCTSRALQLHTVHRMYATAAPETLVPSSVFSAWCSLVSGRGAVAVAGSHRVVRPPPLGVQSRRRVAPLSLQLPQLLAQARRLPGRLLFPVVMPKMM